eukprot:scaffold61933_cov46-Prasinocladus_malaysianus.AAC.1
MIDRFFRPFLGGIFFDRDLNVTSRLFEFVMRMLATGSNCLPAGGIGAVAKQLGDSVPAESIMTGTHFVHCLNRLVCLPMHMMVQNELKYSDSLWRPLFRVTK